MRAYDILKPSNRHLLEAAGNSNLSDSASKLLLYGILKNIRDSDFLNPVSFESFCKTYNIKNVQINENEDEIIKPLLIMVSTTTDEYLKKYRNDKNITEKLGKFIISKTRAKNPRKELFEPHESPMVKGVWKSPQGLKDFIHVRFGALEGATNTGNRLFYTLEDNLPDYPGYRVMKIFGVQTHDEMERGEAVDAFRRAQTSATWVPLYLIDKKPRWPDSPERRGAVDFMIRSLRTNDPVFQAISSSPPEGIEFTSKHKHYADWEKFGGEDFKKWISKISAADIKPLRMSPEEIKSLKDIVEKFRQERELLKDPEYKVLLKDKKYRDEYKMFLQSAEMAVKQLKQARAI